MITVGITAHSQVVKVTSSVEVLENPTLLAAWTLEDCDSKEYWKYMFKVAQAVKLRALDMDLYPDWKNSNFLKTCGNNEVVANKMLLDFMEHGYLIGYIKDGIVINAKSKWAVNNIGS